VTEKPSIRLKFSNSSSAAVDPKPNVQGAAKPKPHPPTIGTEPLTVQCGHTIVFDLYAKDAFRDQRRVKAVKRDCPTCRQARVKADVVAGATRRAKKATFAKMLKPRLPDGARFVATYDASKVQWTGSLTIESTTFERSAPSLNKLLHRLDDEYRASLPPSTPTVETTAQEPSATVS